jgi:hypothetical protein
MPKCSTDGRRGRNTFAASRPPRCRLAFVPFRTEQCPRRNAMDAAPPGSPAAFDLARFMPYRLLMVTNRLSQAFARRYQAEFGITIPESRVLNVTTHFGPLSSHEICERSAMSKSRISAALGRLVAAGLIERETDPADQRLLRLTTSRRCGLACPPMPASRPSSAGRRMRPGAVRAHRAGRARDRTRRHRRHGGSRAAGTDAPARQHE